MSYNVDWTKLWETKAKILQPKHLQAIQLLSKLNEIKSINSICDFGCGQGVLLSKLIELYPNIKLYGADNNDFSKQIVKKLGIEYIDFDLLKNRNKIDIDVAIFTDVLEHFHNPLKVIQNLNNIKYIIIVVPNFNFITERWSVLKGEVPFQMKPQRGGHFFWFNNRTLKELIDSAEYKLIEEYNIYPRKIDYIPFLKKYVNLFVTSFGVLIGKK